jgi:3-hydroxypropanoate dehydrogenase
MPEGETMVAEKSKSRTLQDEALDIIFREARTHRAWQNRDVPDALIDQIYELLKFGPTSGNCCPARFVFVKSKEAKERLRPHLDEGNKEKTMTAPVTAIIAYDLKFYEHMSKLAPHMKDPKAMYGGNPEKMKQAAFLNGTLQGAYLIIAARSLGLDCGPMSGFDADGIKKEFFADNDYVPNFLCNIGYGDASKLHPRAPRFTFDEASKII